MFHIITGSSNAFDPPCKASPLRILRGDAQRHICPKRAGQAQWQGLLRQPRLRGQALALGGQAAEQHGRDGHLEKTNEPNPLMNLPRSTKATMRTAFANAWPPMASNPSFLRSRRGARNSPMTRHSIANAIASNAFSISSSSSAASPPATTSCATLSSPSYASSPHWPNL